MISASEKYQQGIKDILECEGVGNNAHDLIIHCIQVKNVQQHDNRLQGVLKRLYHVTVNWHGTKINVNST